MDNLLASKQADISFLRIVATVGVIFLHTCNTISNNAENYDLTWMQTFVLTTGNYLMNWAVPIFLMITGALLLNEKKIITYKDCITKYCKRMVLALFILGIPFSMLEIIMNTKQVSFSLLPQSVLNVLTGNSWSHLWYLYSLIGIYLVLPMLKAFVDKASRRDLETLLAILLIFNFAIPFANSFFEIDIAFGISITSFEVFYMLLGKYLYDEVPGILKYKKVCGLFLVPSLLLLIIVNYFSVPHGGRYLGYDSVLIVVISAMIFILIKGVRVGNMDMLWKVDRLCFGVYLIHPVFINFVYKFLKMTPLEAGNIYPVAIIGFWIFFVICSFVASWIMNKIRLLRVHVL